MGTVRGEGRRKLARSETFDLDTPSAGTRDTVIMCHSQPVEVLRASIVYVGATAGTVAGGNARLGTTINSTNIAAATAYTNGAVIGQRVNMTLGAAAIRLNANQAIHCRHTGATAVQAGEAFVEIEYEELT